MAESGQNWKHSPCGLELVVILLSQPPGNHQLESNLFNHKYNDGTLMPHLRPLNEQSNCLMLLHYVLQNLISEVEGESKGSDKYLQFQESRV